MKTCKRCGETRPLVEFHTDHRLNDGHKSSCKQCEHTRRTKWRAANQQRDAATLRKSELSRRYGITEDDYQDMLEAQGGVCAICYRPNRSGKRLAVDHCHMTGKVRALLCSPCNTALGLAEDSADRCRAMGAYLDLHQSSQRRKID